MREPYNGSDILLDFPSAQKYLKEHGLTWDLLWRTYAKSEEFKNGILMGGKEFNDTVNTLLAFKESFNSLLE